jgi:hypothetical protein
MSFTGPTPTAAPLVLKPAAPFASGQSGILGGSALPGGPATAGGLKFAGPAAFATGETARPAGGPAASKPAPAPRYRAVPAASPLSPPPGSGPAGPRRGPQGS